MPNDMQALAGVRVLELTNYIAGPMVGRMMADMGAEVVKLEMPPSGDYNRGRMRASVTEPRFNPLHAFYNRGKQSICVDLKRPQGAALIKDLIGHFDVFVENLTPGLLAKYGLGYPELSAVNPRLIMCSVSAFGQTGPLANFPGTDAIAQSMSGVTSMTGDANGTPVFTGVFMADGNAGVSAYGAVVTALFFREKSGLGQYIDLSLSESIFHLHDNSLSQWLFSKGADKPGPFGSHRNGDTPHGFYKAADGYLILVVLNHRWETFTDAVGMPELRSDPRFNTLQARSDNRYVLAVIVQEWIEKKFKSRDDAIKFFRDAGMIAAPVLTVEEAVNHPQFKSRGAMESVDVPDFGPVALPKAPFHMSRTPPHIPNKVAMLGEDNHDVLGKYLGYGADTVAALLESGVIGQDPTLAKRSR
jgi:crotonobetainyl-CoA:carnitine CoA-transferase CaiB-like acyl-CoA transferase